MDLAKYLTSRTALIDRALDRFLPKESAKPPTIHKAMRYSLFSVNDRVPNGHPIVVVTDDFWRRRLSADCCLDYWRK